MAFTKNFAAIVMYIGLVWIIWEKLASATLHEFRDQQTKASLRSFFHVISDLGSPWINFILSQCPQKQCF